MILIVEEKQPFLLAGRVPVALAVFVQNLEFDGFCASVFVLNLASERTQVSERRLAWRTAAHPHHKHLAPDVGFGFSFTLLAARNLRILLLSH